MKTIQKVSTLVLFSILIALTSCEDNLKENIYGTLGDKNFWKTEKDIQEGMNSAYGQLNTRFNGFSIWQFVIEDCCTDINASTSSYVDFSNYTGWSSTTPDAINWGIYKYFWSQISYLNKTIDMIPGSEMSDEKKLAYTSEARALRAFIYFTLVQWFNDIPLVTSSKEISYSIPQESAAKIYKFIEDELIAASEVLPTKEDYIAQGMKDYARMSKGAALALLARTYLVQKKYPECRDVCKQLIEKQDENGKYSLMDNYKTSFTTTGYDNTEFIWALAGDGVNNGMMLQIYLYKPWANPEKSFDNIYLAWNGDISLTYNFYQSFEVGDKRLNCLYYDADSYADRVMLTKYPAKSPDKQFSASDFPVIRYADVLLMYAESLFFADSDVKGAVKWLNKVRERAGVTLYNPDMETTATIKTKLYNERRWELFFEGCGKRDMLRFGTLLNHIQNKSKDAGGKPERYYYLPFPATALTANPALKQNDGYTK